MKSAADLAKRPGPCAIILRDSFWAHNARRNDHWRLGLETPLTDLPSIEAAVDRECLGRCFQ